MKVEVNFFANLRDYSPTGEARAVLDLPGGATAGTLIARLAVPDEVQRVILVNGRHAGEETPLDDGDVITLFPPVEGG